MAINPERDQRGAEGAVHMAVEHHKRVGLAVDDDICAEAMLPRVTKAVEASGCAFQVSRPGPGVIVVEVVGRGDVRIISADHLAGRPGN